MPHQTFAQSIRRRLVGKEGRARLEELQRILTELPGYRNGPYADLRTWVNDEIERTRVRRRVVHHDSIAVRREGAAQIVLVGAPNAGKSSLLQALSDVQIRTGDYAFTTTRPVPATTRIGGAHVQLVEVPGLLDGAADGRGGGRALLGVVRAADGIVWCHPATGPASELEVVRAEVARASIDLPGVVALTKVDDLAPGAPLPAVARPGEEVVEVSVLDEDSLDRLRAAVWRLTGLVRVHLRAPGGGATVVARRPPVTVADVAATIHSGVGGACSGGRIWGPSARFPGQRVGRDHVLADGDEVTIEPSR